MHFHLHSVHCAMNDVTKILSALEHGDPSAADKLLPLVYDELRKLAAARMVYESPDHTLQATALVHEAYLRLVSGSGKDARSWDGRGHFFAAAAEAMRRILVENARRKRRRDFREIRDADIEELPVALPDPREDLLALDEAVTKLSLVDSLAAQLVHFRYFAGLTLPEAAELLEISPRSADRTWAYAKTWLRRELQKQASQK
jgi:RNA polymerase sigma factor (TIGR02999 family)